MRRRSTVILEPVDLVRLVRVVARRGCRRPGSSRPRRRSSWTRIRGGWSGSSGNLLDNAREHAGGSDVEIDLESGPAAIVLTVADRGPGVPADRLDRIFERFSKLDPSRSQGSSGLGLAIAAEHAAILGGQLEASNRDGGGLRVALVLPGPEAVAGSLPPGDGFVMRGLDDEGPPSRTREPVR